MLRLLNRGRVLCFYLIVWMFSTLWIKKLKGRPMLRLFGMRCERSSVTCAHRLSIKIQLGTCAQTDSQLLAGGC